MGQWSFTVTGTGPHHNGKPTDVEAVARDVVEKLRDSGHTVASAKVTTGSEIDVSFSPAFCGAKKT